GDDVSLAMDVAATQLVTAHGDYFLRREARTLSSAGMIEQVLGWVERFPIVSIEDPLGEDDWEAWRTLTARLGGRIQLLGDDLFCTNVSRIRRGTKTRWATPCWSKRTRMGRSGYPSRPLGPRGAAGSG